MPGPIVGDRDKETKKNTQTKQKNPATSKSFQSSGETATATHCYCNYHSVM